MRVVSYGVRCSFQRTGRWGGTIVSSAINQLQLLTFSPAIARRSFAAVAAAAVAETARHIRRSLLPLVFLPEQSATPSSLCRTVGRSGRGHRRARGRRANAPVLREAP